MLCCYDYPENKKGKEKMRIYYLHNKLLKVFLYIFL